MDLLTIALVIIIVGIALWLVNAYIPMQAGIKKILNIVVIIFLIIFLLKAFGLLDNLHNLRI